MPKTKTPSKRKPNPAFMRPVQPDDKLAAVVGSKPLPRSELTKKLWDYIKKNGLQDKTKTTQKLVLLDFTGSDWCGFCFQLDRAILSKPQFKDYASKNLVLVEVDFPRRKAQSIETKRQNQQLAQRYQIEGFPTLVVLNGE